MGLLCKFIHKGVSRLSKIESAHVALNDEEPRISNSTLGSFSVDQWFLQSTEVVLKLGHTIESPGRF